MDQVCKSSSLSRKYSLGAGDFSTEDDRSDFEDSSHDQYIPGIRFSLVTRSKDYDIHSIMHYSSWHLAKGAKFPDVTLMKWKWTFDDINDVPMQATLQNSEYIYVPEVPSLLDIQAVKDLYPPPW
jgi:hypothetical protein